jgi:hypothetical protein
MKICPLIIALFSVLRLFGTASGSMVQQNNNMGTRQAIAPVNPAIMPTQIIYRHWAQHSPRHLTYASSNAISFGIIMTTAVFAIAFARSQRRANMTQATIMAIIAEHLHRLAYPGQNDVYNTFNLIDDMMVGTNAMLQLLVTQHTHTVMWNSFHPDADVRQEVAFYIMGFLNNGIRDDTPFPTNFIANPWIDRPGNDYEDEPENNGNVVEEDDNSDDDNGDNENAAPAAPVA